MTGDRDVEITVRGITRDRLDDLEEFSTGHGTFRYCSCQRWRMTSTEFKKSSKEDRVGALAEIVSDGNPVGVLAYSGSAPIGWCSVAPRTSYRALQRYRALPPIDDEPVWSVVCFFVDSKFRSRGVMTSLLRGAVAYAHEQGAE